MAAESSPASPARDAAWLAEAISLGHEQRTVEFKPPGPRTDKRLRAVVIRAVLAMANTSTGGAVVIGVPEVAGTLVPKGLTDADVETWRPDHTLDSIAPYADPDPEVAVKTIELDGRKYVVLLVRPFADVPIVCRTSFTVRGDVVLSEGALYIRPRLKPESAPVGTAADMREILDLAAEKLLHKYLGTAHRAGGAAVPRQREDEKLPDDDAEQFDEQVKDVIDE
jgi:hypothetical protein